MSSRPRLLYLHIKSLRLGGKLGGEAIEGSIPAEIVTV